METMKRAYSTRGGVRRLAIGQTVTLKTLEFQGEQLNDVKGILIEFKEEHGSFRVKTIQKFKQVETSPSGIQREWVEQLTVDATIDSVTEDSFE